MLALGGAVFMFTNFFHCETFLVFLLRGISFELVIYIFQGFLSSILNGLYSPLNKYSPHHASFFDCHFTHGGYVKKAKRRKRMPFYFFAKKIYFHEKRCFHESNLLEENDVFAKQTIFLLRTPFFAS